MKNIYNISKGQLITVWVFGLIGLVASLGESDYSGFAKFLSILIPASLVFYTIGWKNSNKESSNELQNGLQSTLREKVERGKNKLRIFLNFLKRKKIALIIIFGIFIGVIVIFNTLKHLPPVSLDNVDSGEELKMAARYAKENPDTEYAAELKKRLLAGQYNDEIKEAGGKLPENNFNQSTCKGDIKDLVILDSEHQTFDEHDYKSSIKYNENGIRFYGILKNNSICTASNIYLKVTLQSTKNPDIKQEETQIVFLDNPYRSISPQQTKQYELTFNVFESLLLKQKDQFGLNTVVKSSLRSDVTSKIEVSSVFWGN